MTDGLWRTVWLLSGPMRLALSRAMAAKAVWHGCFAAIARPRVRTVFQVVGRVFAAPRSPERRILADPPYLIVSTRARLS